MFTIFKKIVLIRKSPHTHNSVSVKIDLSNIYLSNDIIIIQTINTKVDLKKKLIYNEFNNDTP